MRTPALIVLALAASLAACNKPADVCIADETVSTARSLLLDHLIGDPNGVDVDLVRRAFDDVVTFELIRFEGEDKSTRTIRCRAQVKSPNSRGLAEVIYVRQPNIGAKGYPVVRGHPQGQDVMIEGLTPYPEMKPCVTKPALIFRPWDPPQDTTERDALPRWQPVGADE